MSASYDADRTPVRRDPAKMLDYVKSKGCPKCGQARPDYTLCKRYCPIPGSPNYHETAFKEEFVKARL